MNVDLRYARAHRSSYLCLLTLNRSEQALTVPYRKRHSDPDTLANERPSDSRVRRDPPPHDLYLGRAIWRAGGVGVSIDPPATFSHIGGLIAHCQGVLRESDGRLPDVGGRRLGRRALAVA